MTCADGYAATGPEHPASGAVPRAGRPAPQCHAWQLPLTELSVRSLRRGLRPLLADSGLPDEVVHDLVLAACEAATNAVEHALRPAEPYIDVLYEASEGDVTITVRDHGQWCEEPSGAHRGRGLSMMRALADTTVSTRSQGTTVVLRNRPDDGDLPDRPLS